MTMLFTPFQQRVDQCAERAEVVRPQQGTPCGRLLEGVLVPVAGPRNRQGQQSLVVPHAAHQAYPAGRPAGVERERLPVQRVVRMRDHHVGRICLQFPLIRIREPWT